MIKRINQKAFNTRAISNRFNSTYFRSQKGLTLIELLFVLAIVGVLGLVAIPSFSQMMSQNLLVSNANQLQSIFKFARSEAAKRHESIDLKVNADDEWEVVLSDGTVIQKFSSTSDTVSVTGLADLTLLDTGEVSVNALNGNSSINYLITDGDTDTTDYCFSVLLSGQTSLTKENICSAI